MAAHTLFVERLPLPCVVHMSVERVRSVYYSGLFKTNHLVHREKSIVNEHHAKNQIAYNNKK